MPGLTPTDIQVAPTQEMTAPQKAESKQVTQPTKRIGQDLRAKSRRPNINPAELLVEIAGVSSTETTLVSQPEQSAPVLVQGHPLVETPSATAPEADEAKTQAPTTADQTQTTPTREQKPQPPRFIKEFSRERSRSERDELAGAIRVGGRKAIQDFYEREKEKWARTPYSKKDIQKNFTEEHLASLSMEDYILLLRRFPSEMVTHVTRQGIRDHVGGDFHTAGLGEYEDGFMQIASKGRLRSSFGIYLQEGMTDEAIAKCLDLGGTMKTRQDAELMLQKIVNRGQAEPGSYADTTAVHFAAEEIADVYYGGEQGNEIFFSFPSAHIASEYYFAGQLTESAGGNHNDQWVWTGDKNGIGIDAGIVFIPAVARVDRETGSRYQLDQNRRPIERQDYVQAATQFVQSEGFPGMYESIMTTLGTTDPTSEGVQDLRTRLAQEFGISDPDLQNALLDNNRIVELNIASYYSGLETDDPMELFYKEEHSVDGTVRSVLQEANILYKEVTNAIPSQEFWENYFAQHPDQRPKHVVYYQGDNPTEVLRQWRESEGITNKAEDQGDLGFSERHIASTEGFGPQASLGIEHFQSRAVEVIDSYFTLQPDIPVAA